MIDQAARGDWRELDHKLRPFVARRVRTSADVDDVVQDIFLRLQRGLRDLRDDERFGPWVYRVARSAIADHRRARSRGVIVSEPLVDEGSAGSEGADESDETDGDAVACELAMYVAPFVATLPSPYREALTLTELSGLSQREAAEMMGISLSGMKSRVQRGREKLRAALEACCDIALDARGRVVGCERREDGFLPAPLENTRVVPRCSPRMGGSMTAAAPELLASSPAHWTAADVRDDASWTYVLSTAEHDDLVQAAALLGDRPLASLLPRDRAHEGPLAEAARGWRDELKRGRGFVLVRGLDVATVPTDELARRLVVLGLHLGELVPQNLRGDLLTHVRDTGADPSALATRLYTTRAEQDFHTDGADVIGLLCRRPARSGGESRLVSSGTLVREMQRVRPDLYQALFGAFPWHYQEEGQPPLWFARPICTTPGQLSDGALLNTFFIPWYIRRSQELPEAPRLTATQAEALAMLASLANEPRFYMNMSFRPGDVQWLKNAAILHKRTAYEDHESDDEKRHLLRLWISAPDFADGHAELRGGVRKDEAPGGGGRP